MRLSRCAGQRRYLFTIIAAAILTAATAAVLLGDWRYETTSEQVLAHPWSADGAEHWWKRGRATVHTLDNLPVAFLRAEQPAGQIRQLLVTPNEFPFLRFQAQVRSVNLTAPEHWQGGVIGLYTIGASGKHLRHWPRARTRVVGTTPWHHVEGTIPVTPHTKRVFVAASAFGTQGLFAVRDLQVRALTEHRYARALRYAVMLCWSILWLWVMYTVRAHRSVTRALTVAVANVLLVAALAPQPALNDFLKGLFFRSQDAVFIAHEAFENISEAIQSELPAEVPRPSDASAPSAKPSQPQDLDSQNPEATSENTLEKQKRFEESRRHAPLSPLPRTYWKPQWDDFDKVEHIASFVLLAFLAGVAYRREPLGRRLGTLLMVSICLQTLQLFSPTREAELSDFRADGIGILAGTVLCFLWYRVFNRMRRPPYASEKN